MYKPTDLGKVNPRIDQTEVAPIMRDDLGIPSGEYYFTVWTPSGAYRTTLIPDRLMSDDELTEWGRAAWVDTRWVFHKVGSIY